MPKAKVKPTSVFKEAYLGGVEQLSWSFAEKRIQQFQTDEALHEWARQLELTIPLQILIETQPPGNKSQKIQRVIKTLNGTSNSFKIAVSCVVRLNAEHVKKAWQLFLHERTIGQLLYTSLEAINFAIKSILSFVAIILRLPLAQLTYWHFQAERLQKRGHPWLGKLAKCALFILRAPLQRVANILSYTANLIDGIVKTAGIVTDVLKLAEVFVSYILGNIIGMFAWCSVTLTNRLNRINDRIGGFLWANDVDFNFVRERLQSGVLRIFKNVFRIAPEAALMCLYVYLPGLGQLIGEALRASWTYIPYGGLALAVASSAVTFVTDKLTSGFNFLCNKIQNSINRPRPRVTPLSKAPLPAPITQDDVNLLNSVHVEVLQKEKRKLDEKGAIPNGYELIADKLKLPDYYNRFRIRQDDHHDYYLSVYTTQNGGHEASVREIDSQEHAGNSWGPSLKGFDVSMFEGQLFLKRKQLSVHESPDKENDYILDQNQTCSLATNLSVD